jgi:hypothetical protein
MKYDVTMDLFCHDIQTKFHKDWFRYSNVVKRNTKIQTGGRSHKPTQESKLRISIPFASLIVRYIRIHFQTAWTCMDKYAFFTINTKCNCFPVIYLDD